MFERGAPLRFVFSFLSLFLVLYYFNIFYFALTSRANYYSAFLDQDLNYIRWLRHLLLSCSAALLRWLGYTVITNDIELLVAGRGTIQLVYSCLGLGIMSFFSAFVIAYPKKLKAKLIFLLSGILAIQLLNVFRFVVLALFWHKSDGLIVDHHTVFNIVIYVIIAISLYFWIKHDDKPTTTQAKN